ncbi:hypothetical protein MKX03_020777 [Papaver bracteatum]|nr:hypothetical protein MKX03_020777 [Papaver bracteatum]
MVERIYPAEKPTTNPTPTQPLNKNTNGNHADVMNGNGGVNQIFPPPKSQLYRENRPTYRPLPRHHRRQRIILLCFSNLVLIGILLLAAISGGVIYSIYQPKKPSFSLTALKITQFNITNSKSDDTAHLNSKLNLTILAKSENKYMIYYFNPMNVSVTPQNHPDVEIGSGSDFILGTHNRTSLRFVLTTANSLKSYVKKKNAFPIKVRLNTKVKVKMGVFNTRKVGLLVTCEHIKILSETKTITEVSKVQGGKNTTSSVTTWNIDEKSFVKQN